MFFDDYVFQSTIQASLQIPAKIPSSVFLLTSSLLISALLYAFFKLIKITTEKSFSLLLDIKGGRSQEERIKLFQYCIENTDDRSKLLLFGRSLVDVSSHWRQLQEAINNRNTKVKVAILDEKSIDIIQTPSPDEWAYKDVGISMDRFKRIKVNPNSTGHIEIYGLDFYLSHSFIAYTNRNDKYRYCIEEAGMAIPVEERPYHITKELDHSEKVNFVQNLEKMYSSLLVPSRLIFRADHTGHHEKELLSDESITYKYDNNALSDLRRFIGNSFKKWQNPDLLRGPWQKVVVEKSLEIFRALISVNNSSKISPVSAHYEITNRCNSKCLHCERWKWQNGNDPNINEAILVINKIHKLGVETVTIGGGEPLLYSKLDKILLEGSRLGMHLGLITNGMQLDDRFLKPLCEHTEWIRFSIDASEEATYKKIRSSQFGLKTVLDNIQKVNHTKKKLNQKQPELGVNFVIQNGNVNELEKMIAIGDEKSIDKIIFKIVHGENNQKITSADYEKIVDQLNKIERNGSIFRHNIKILKKMITEDLSPDDILSGFPTKTFYDSRNIKCFAPFFFLTIDPSGDIYPCDYLLYDTRAKDKFSDLRNTYNMGNVLELTDSGGKLPDKMDKIIKMVHVIDTERIKECGCCTRFYRFNALMTELYGKYESLCRETNLNYAHQCFEFALKREVREIKQSWL